MFRFATPWFLWLLLPVLAVWALRRRRVCHPGLRVPGLAGLGSRLPVSIWLRARPLVESLRYVSVVLLVFALAGPQWGREQTSILSEGVNIVIAVDVSESMAALDFKLESQAVNRLEAVKHVVRHFLAGRVGDRIGLVVFGTEAYTQLPLTRDYNAIVQALERMEIGSAGRTTSIGDGLGISIKRLLDVKSKSNVVILLTDGRNNSGELSPALAADIAARAKVKVYTIGVGGKEPAPFVIDNPMFGRQIVYQNVDIDEETLEDVAKTTGGLYFRAENTDGLEHIYKTIDQLEKSEARMKIHADYRELYSWFVLPAFVLFGLWMLLVNTRYMRLP